MFTYDNNGNRQQIVENYNANAGPVAPQPSPSPAENNKSKLHKILMFVLGALLAVALGLLLMSLLKKNDSPAPAETIMSAFGMKGKRGGRYGFNFY